MLQTLLKIGEWQSQGKSEWDRFLDFPKIEKEDKYGNPIKNYTLPIIFDLDEKRVVIESENLIEYSPRAIQDKFPLKIKGGNNKAIYTAVGSKSLNQIYKTFFGKEGAETETGELYEAIQKVNPALLTEIFNSLLAEIFKLKDEFLSQTLHSSKNNVDIRAINEAFNLEKNENIVFIIVQVKAQEYGYDDPLSFSEIQEYRDFLDHSFFGSNKKDKKKKTQKKLCYASGEFLDDVEELDLSTRYSLNKMFVTETRNYATVFDKNKFTLNYQVNTENQEKLDYASNYLLNQGYKVRIANLDHVILPQFLHNSEVDLEMALDSINKKSDLLFNIKKLGSFTTAIEDELQDDEIFWINFTAFESDGNFFKSTEIIKDVSNFHFNKLIRTFNEINWRYREASFVEWNKVMMDYDFETKERRPTNLNFNSLFKIIPLRKDKEKKNKALDLFKTILENRKVNISLLYDYFNELILCHFYGRYNSYTNVQQYSKDYFYIAVRDSVFKYLAFIQLLKQLNLIDMEDTNSTTENLKQYDQKESDFFNEMNLNQEQRAMFYLGRMLNQVEYIQTKDKKKKTVIEKVNFNGLEIGNIQRLRNDLNEKAKQYRLKYPKETNSVVFIDNKFAGSFDFNKWVNTPLNPQEALFFLLTGYSFGAKNNDNPPLQNDDN